MGVKESNAILERIANALERIASALEVTSQSTDFEKQRYILHNLPSHWIIILLLNMNQRSNRLSIF